MQTLSFSTSGLPDDQAFSEWRDLLAPMVRVERARGGLVPRGNLSCTLLGEILFSRMTFNAQLMIRERARAEGTPDHFTTMLYPVGGLEGDLAGEAVSRQPTRIMAVDMAKQMFMRGHPSSAFGLTIPRTLLAGIDLHALPVRLDPERNRLLVARLNALSRSTQHPETVETPVLAGELIAFVRRLLDRSRCRDVLQGAELDVSVVELAERLIERYLPVPDISPTFIAERLGISRSTLYRAFERTGGVMQRVWEMRLDAIRAALDDPFEIRPLETLAHAHGFKSVPHMNRSFRLRFGHTPGAWRRERMRQEKTVAQADKGLAHRWYDRLGHAGPPSDVREPAPLRHRSVAPEARHSR